MESECLGWSLFQVNGSIRLCTIYTFSGRTTNLFLFFERWIWYFYVCSTVDQTRQPVVFKHITEELSGAIENNQDFLREKSPAPNSLSERQKGLCGVWKNCLPGVAQVPESWLRYGGIHFCICPTTVRPLDLTAPSGAVSATHPTRL